jgi:hypothetical protein
VLAEAMITYSEEALGGELIACPAVWNVFMVPSAGGRGIPAV